MGQFPDAVALAEADESLVLKCWEGLGYYSRARNLHRAAKRVRDVHDGEFPSSFENIRALPGVGPYTAGAIASIAFGQARPIVDGNVIRVLTRVDGIRENARSGEVSKRLWARAGELVEKADAHSTERANPCGDFNQALMELGATICGARQPECGRCPLKRSCVALRSGLSEAIPNLGKRPPSVSKTFLAVVLRRRGKVLIRQRGAEEVNARLWEFPNTELTDDDVSGAKWLGRVLGINASSLCSLGAVKHTIMNQRITLRVDSCDFRAPGQVGLEGVTRWASQDELQELAFPAAHRKIVERFLPSAVTES